MKVEICEARENVGKLKQLVNDFIKTHKIIDIKYSTTCDKENYIIYSAMIIYE